MRIAPYKISKQITECRNFEDIFSIMDNSADEYDIKSIFFIDLKKWVVIHVKTDKSYKYKDEILNYCDEQIIYWQEKERKIKLKEDRELELLQSNIDNNISNKKHRTFITWVTIANILFTIINIVIAIYKSGTSVK